MNKYSTLIHAIFYNFQLSVSVFKRRRPREPPEYNPRLLTCSCLNGFLPLDFFLLKRANVSVFSFLNVFLASGFASSAPSDLRRNL